MAVSFNSFVGLSGLNIAKAGSCCYSTADVLIILNIQVFKVRLSVRVPAIKLGSHPHATQVSASCTGAAVVKSTHVSKPLVMSKSWGYIKCRRRPMHVFVADGDRMITDASNNDARITDGLPSPSLDVSLPPQRHLEAKTENDSELPTSDASTPRRTSLTARERLRAARVLSRYSESKATKSEMGSSVLDALRESDKGKKGLPEAPTNLFDDSKRGLPNQGLTFNFPGGVDLLIIAFSVVFISTVMFATTYIVWKAGAIHFNEY